MRSASRNTVSVTSKQPESELEAILELTENAFVVYDDIGRIRTSSRRLGPLLRLSKSEWSSLRDFGSFSRLLKQRLANGHHPLHPPWVLWQANGAGREQLEIAENERIIERIARPVVNESGEITGWVERYRDFTSECELPARLLQTDKLAALGQMVAGIAHELNNPLTTVMGYGHLLLERSLDPKALGDAHRICEEAERAARIVRNLLMLTREAKLERSPVNLNEMVDRTVRLCAYEMQRNGTTTETDLDPHLPNTLANPIQLQQVVLNLLVNSQQAIAESGRPGRVVLRTRHGADHVFLHVEDNGPGIPIDLHSRIFEPFFTTKPVGVGTGLGLPIITGILRQHGGEIKVASTPGEGATFTVSLPAVRERPQELPSGKLEASPPVPGRRILVAEGEPSVARLIVEAVTETGYSVDAAADGEEALQRAKETEYDLVICDWKIPRLDGLELYRVLAGSSNGRCERLLLISSDPSLCTSSEFLRNSKLVCLTKPFLLSELKEAVARLLAQQKGLA